MNKLVNALFIIIVPLSIAGVRVLDATGIQGVVFAAQLAIALALVLVLIYRNWFSNRQCLIYVGVISLSIVSMLWFRSTNLVGNDIHLEYGLYQKFVRAWDWSVLQDDLLGRCPMVTVVPGVIMKGLGLAGNRYEIWIYKGTFAVASCAVPMLVYSIMNRLTSREAALVASIFVMVQITFITSATTPRHSLALCLFALSLYLIFFAESRWLSYGVLTVTLVVMVFTHYTTVYIAIGLFVFAILVAMAVAAAKTKKVIMPPLRVAVPIGVMAIVSVLWLHPINAELQERSVPAIGKTSEKLITRAKEAIVEDKAPVELDTKYLSQHKIYNPIIPMLVGKNLPHGASWGALVLNWLLFLAIGAGLVFSYSRLPLLYWLMGLGTCLILVFTIIIPYLSYWYSPLSLFTQTIIINAAFIPAAFEKASRYLRTSPVLLACIIAVPLYLYNCGLFYQLLGLPPNTVLYAGG